MALTITRDDANLIATAAAEREAEDSFQTLVRAVLEDGLEPGSPLKEMGRHFGPWPWGEGFGPDSVNKFSWLAPFFYEDGTRDFKKHAPRGPMSTAEPVRNWNYYDADVGGWKPWGDVMLVPTKTIDPEDPRKKKEITVEAGPGWFNRAEITDQFSWLTTEPGEEVRRDLEGDAYFLRGLILQSRQQSRVNQAARLGKDPKDMKNEGKKSGYFDYFESLRLFLRDLLAQKKVKFDQVVELFKTFSLEDFKNLKRNKGWRDYMDQFSNRRQEGEGGKTLIHKNLKAWAFDRHMIRDCLLFVGQDVLAGEKPAATESRQAIRLNQIKVDDMNKKINMVWIWAFPPREGFWMRLLGLFRMFGIKPNIFDDLSGEEPWTDPDLPEERVTGAVDEFDDVPWPNVDDTSTPIYGIAASVLFERDASGNRVLRQTKVPQNFVDSRWDTWRLKLYAKVDRPRENKILDEFTQGLFTLKHSEVLKLMEEDVWKGEREDNLLLAVLWPRRISPERTPMRYVVDPVVLNRILHEEEWQNSLAEVSPVLVSLVDQGNQRGLNPKERETIRKHLEAELRKIIRNPQDLVTVLRKICGAINVAVIYGWSEVPYQGLAKMMNLADETWDARAFLLTELADLRGDKGLNHNDMGIVAAYREPICWHPYDPRNCPNHRWANNSGIICRGWKFDGWEPLWGEGPVDYKVNGGVEPPVYWFLRNRWSWLLEKIHMANLRSDRVDDIKYGGRAKELGYPVPETADPKGEDELGTDAKLMASKHIPKDMMIRRLSLKARVNPAFRGKNWPTEAQYSNMDAADGLLEYNWALLVQRTVHQMVNVFNVMFRRDGKTFTYDEILNLVELASREVDSEVMYGLRFQAERPDTETEGGN